MGFKPALTAAQWAKVTKLLPENRHDPVMVEAIAYRAFTGLSLAETAETFGIKKVRLHVWEHAIAHLLPQIMATLKLEPASPQARARGGHRQAYYRNPDMLAAILAIRMCDFRDALRGRS